MKVVIALGVLALAGVALAEPQYGHLGPVHAAPVTTSFSPAPSYGPQPIYNDIPRYNFNYAVKDYNGNDFGHQETRDGYNTKGSYYVQLPDGRLQHVKYYVNGDSGFVAEVTYIGEAKHPATYGSAPAPTYGPVPAYG